MCSLSICIRMFISLPSFSIRRLGARWRRVSPHQGLLSMLTHLYDAQQLNDLDIDWLDALVYSGMLLCCC